MDQLKKQIKAKTPDNLYIFYGSEAYLRDFYIDKLKELLIPPGTETFNLSVFEKKGFNAETFTSALNAAPFMSERRLIIVQDVDIFKQKDEFESVFKSQWTDTTVIFTYEAMEYKPDARTKLYKSIAAFATIVEFKPQSERDLIPWIKRHFASLDRQIDTEAAQYLIFLCGKDMTTLLQEIRKIAAFCTVSEVTQRHIEAVGTPTVEAVAFDLTDAIAAGDCAKAYDILHKLMDMREEPIMMVGAIGKQARGLYLARLAIDRGLGRDVVMRGMGYRHTFPADKLLHSAKKFSLERCRHAVTSCFQADSELKLGYDKALTLERLIAEMAT